MSERDKTSSIAECGSDAAMPEHARQHAFNPNGVRHTKSLGDACGLQQIGVHLVRLESGRESTEYHAHNARRRVDLRALGTWHGGDRRAQVRGQGRRFHGVRCRLRASHDDQSVRGGSRSTWWAARGMRTTSWTTRGEAYGHTSSPGSATTCSPSISAKAFDAGERPRCVAGQAGVSGACTGRKREAPRMRGASVTKSGGRSLALLEDKGSI